MSRIKFVEKEVFQKSSHALLVVYELLVQTVSVLVWAHEEVRPKHITFQILRDDSIERLVCWCTQFVCAAARRSGAECVPTHAEGVCGCTVVDKEICPAARRQ